MAVLVVDWSDQQELALINNVTVKEGPKLLVDERRNTPLPGVKMDLCGKEAGAGTGNLKEEEGGGMAAVQDVIMVVEQAVGARASQRA